MPRVERARGRGSGRRLGLGLPCRRRFLIWGWGRLLWLDAGHTDDLFRFERTSVYDVQKGGVLYITRVRLSDWGLLRSRRRTSVNVIISLSPEPPNLTFRTLHPGARKLLPDHSNISSESHPLASPFPSRLDGRDLSVSKTFNGFVLRTSQTATRPSCEATANLEPSPEKAVEKDAINEAGMYIDGVEVVDGSLRVAIGENVMREPPFISCRETLEESPTDKRVRPSGDIDAVMPAPE